MLGSRRLGFIRAVVFILLAVLAASSHAAGNVTFGGEPAVREEEPQGPGFAKKALSKPQEFPQGPGFNRAVLSPVTPEESERAIHSRPLPRNLNKGVPARNEDLAPTVRHGGVATTRVSGDHAPQAPVSIAELARALKNDPDLIYQYVRNNIEYYPIWGVQKGAIGAIIDNQGTAFDQAILMVTLLRQAGYTASYVKGRISLTAPQVRDWLGVDTSNACAVAQLLASGQVPIASVTATVAGSCPGSTAALVGVEIDHVWVKVNIDGADYVFDPSFKDHTLITGINLATAMGYDQAAFLTSARTGATITADYVQKLYRNGIRNKLGTYAASLASYLRTNKPAGVLDDVLGGKTINPYYGGDLRQTLLAYQDTGVAVTEWTEVPDAYRPTLRVQYQGIDQTYTSDALYGKRLTITYDASNQPLLSLDGVMQATGTAIAVGTAAPITLSVTHGAYAQTTSNQQVTKSIKAGGTYLIGNGWGSAGRGMIEFHRARLDEAKEAGSADTSEIVMGSSLAVLSTTWIAEVGSLFHLNDRIAGTNTLQHHLVGIAGYDESSYVDLPANVVSVVSEVADASKQSAAFYNAAMHGSVFESTAVHEVSEVSAVSTVKLIDISATNGDKIFDTTAGNYAISVKPNLLSCSSYLATFESALSNGHRLVLPARCNITENNWSGLGYFDISGNGKSISALIGGAFAGGFSSQKQSAFGFTSKALKNSFSPLKSLFQWTGRYFGDPVDMMKGHYLYTHNDMVVGEGAFPFSLDFERLYSSGLRLQTGPLGRGWTHNLAATATAGSDGFQGLGEDSALDAVTSIAETYVSFDMLSDAAKPLDKLVIATLGQAWFGEQLVNNTVIVKRGLNGEVFVKLPSGTYNAPPGNSTKLIKNADGTYTYDMMHHEKLNFDSTGKVATFVHPSGVQVNFTYSGNDLTQVQNSLGRSLTLTNVGGAHHAGERRQRSQRGLRLRRSW